MTSTTIPKNVENLQISLDDAKVRIREDRKGRMKIHIDLNQIESEGFTKVNEVLNVHKIPMDQFAKTLLFMGIQTLKLEAQRVLKEIQEKEKPFTPTNIETSGTIEMIK